MKRKSRKHGDFIRGVAMHVHFCLGGLEIFFKVTLRVGFSSEGNSFSCVFFCCDVFLGKYVSIDKMHFFFDCSFF